MPNKFDQLKTIIGNNIDILIITETKVDSRFPNSQFMTEGFSMPFKLDRNRFGGRIMIYVREDILSKQLAKHKLPDDIEGFLVEMNLRKTKWLIFGGYRRPRQAVEYSFKHLSFALDTYRQTYEKFLLTSDFNIVETEPLLSGFLGSYDSKNLVKK